MINNSPITCTPNLELIGKNKNLLSWDKARMPLPTYPLAQGKRKQQPMHENMSLTQKIPKTPRSLIGFLTDFERVYRIQASSKNLNISTGYEQ